MKQLRWSNRARTEISVSSGQFVDGNAHAFGYVDLAMHIAKNPRKFTSIDCVKAMNILRANGSEKLLASMREELG